MLPQPALIVRAFYLNVTTVITECGVWPLSLALSLSRLLSPASPCFLPLNHPLSHLPLAPLWALSLPSYSLYPSLSLSLSMTPSHLFPISLSLSISVPPSHLSLPSLSLSLPLSRPSQSFFLCLSHRHSLALFFVNVSLSLAPLSLYIFIDPTCRIGLLIIFTPKVCMSHPSTQQSSEHLTPSLRTKCDHIFGRMEKIPTCYFPSLFSAVIYICEQNAVHYCC